MSKEPHDQRDFFVSFNSADREWAEWIAYELEKGGYTTFFQHWDFSPGSNFPLEMHKAASQAHKTIAVLSQDYLDAVFTQPEWSAALVQDPTGAKRTLIPVRVQSCQPRGILAPIVYIDLVGLSEADARDRLLLVAQGNRPKPKHVSFPTDKKQFPGQLKPGPPPKRPPSETSASSWRAEPTSQQPPEKNRASAGLPFLWFVLALLGVAIIIALGDKLIGLGLINQLYYLVLVALGLGAAGALFAGMHSSARYRGRVSFGTLEISGPAVIFFLVVGAGIYFSPGQKPFALTVFVHGPGGPQDLILRNQGRVALDLGPDRQWEQIGEKGTAFFPVISADYHGRDIPVSIIADGYARVNEKPLHLTGDSLYVLVKKKAVVLKGVVVDRDGEPVHDAVIHIADQTATTEADGSFKLYVAGELVKEELTLDVRAQGFFSQTLTVVPNSNEIRLVLREHKPQ